MKFTATILAALSFGSMAFAAPAEASAAVPAPEAQASSLAPNHYCDKYNGRERDSCLREPTANYCNKYNGREREECFRKDEYRGGPPPRGNYCDKYIGGSEHRACLDDVRYCDKFRGGERRECESQPRGRNW